MNGITALSVAAALVGSLEICRRKWVGVLGAYGRALAPAALLILWFGSLGLGQRTGSLAAMGWIAASPLILLAGIAVARSRRLRVASVRWTAWDKGAFLLLAASIIAYCGNDNFCHYAVIGAYLRGNIPPSAPNDPDVPLRYHTSFDAAAALVADAFQCTPETALDLVSITCVFACLCCLQAISRLLFEGRWTQQVARLCFVLGFGPIYLNHVQPLISRLAGWRRESLGSFLFHGHTTQSFAASIHRRPMGLNDVIFVFVLAACLPRLTSARRRGVGPARAPHPAWLLPCAFLLPQASEELTCLMTMVVAWSWVSGGLSFRWMVAWALTVLAALPLSGVLSALLSPGTAASVPHVAPSWPPSLPYWVDLQRPGAGPRDADLALITRGLPLFSRDAGWVLLTEWGPLFFGGLVLGLGDPRRRVIAALFCAGFLLACGLQLEGWIKADLDRFLFYGTFAGFLLSATWVELLEAARRRGTLAGPWSRLLALALVVLPTILGPTGFATRYIAHWVLQTNSRLPIAFSDAELVQLRAALAAVGPREQVLSDARYSQKLVLAGFVVAAPLAPGFSIGIVDHEGFDRYLRTSHRVRPAWLFLPASDPRVADRPRVAEFHGYALVKCSRMDPARRSCVGSGRRTSRPGLR